MNRLILTVSTFLICLLFVNQVSAGQGAVSVSALVLGCGEGIVNFDEQCDSSNLGGKTCTALGFLDGELTCNSSCTFNTSACLVDKVKEKELAILPIKEILIDRDYSTSFDSLFKGIELGPETNDGQEDNFLTSNKHVFKQISLLNFKLTIEDRLAERRLSINPSPYLSLKRIDN